MSLLGNLMRAGRIGLGRSTAVRFLRLRTRYPGLAADPSANLLVEGRFEYADGVVLAEGSNVIVPKGATLRLGQGCYVGRYAELGPLGSMDVGDRTSIQDRSILVCDVSLRRYCMLSLNVLMTSGVHYFDRWPHLLIRDQDRRVSESAEQSSAHSRPIVVDDDCWLGMNAVVSPGVHVGRGCVIGANSVVTHDLPPYSVAAGTPARIIRQRLEFVPPARIDWREALHYPYFYGGFLLAEDERARNANLEGHLGLPRFALWLAAGEEIRIRARCARGNQVRLECSGTSVDVSPDWAEYRFPRSSPGGPEWFSAASGNVVVSEAWVA